MEADMKTLENELEVTDARLLKMASYKSILRAIFRMKDRDHEVVRA